MVHSLRDSLGRYLIKPAEDPNKILFVTPPYHCGVVEVTGRWIPLNFVYLAGVARQAGLVAEIYDAMAKDHGYPEMAQRFTASKAVYVASTALTSTINDAVKTLELAKSIKPDTVTILGGVHPTFMYEEVLQSSAGVDYIVCGEGENTLRELLTVLEEGGNPATVPGLAFRQGNGIVKTPKRCFMESIDDLPAAWDLLDWQDYRYLIIPDSRLGAISTSRGCDHDCIFCSQQKFWEKSWRARDPQKVADELEYLYQTFGVNVFLVTDEYPTRNRERWEALLDAVIAKELPIHLIMETRPPDIIRDREILWKYRKAGIVHISIGIEATDQATLDFIRKDMKVDATRQALTLLREHGIVSETSFILGFPDETNASVKRTLQQAQEYNPDIANFLALTPWPYADMYADITPYIRVWDYAKYNLIDPIIEPQKMSMLQIEVAIVDCFRKFNMGKIIEIMTMKDDFRRGYLLRASKLMMGSSFIVRKLGVGLLGKVPAKVEEMRNKFGI
jgi:anaerobic magnesium-protoporphyrin IX monomethyl ester cyclase